MDKKTPLYQCHVDLKAKITGFAGYLLPMQYSSIIAEHNAVRQGCGIFDVSHMGEFLLEGADALKNLNSILTNDFTSLEINKARYSPMCYVNGGTVDDLLVYRKGGDSYMLVVNASNTKKDFEHISKNLEGDVTFKDISENIGQIAVQGPEAYAIMEKLSSLLPEAGYSFLETKAAGRDALISRTGYTGEDGFEIYCKNSDAPEIYAALCDAGAVPCGLGARDTLRLEAGMALYGHELSESITPLETGLFRFVKTEKPFIGREALSTPQKRTLIGIEILDRGIARQGDKVISGGKTIGCVTSGTFSPTLKKAICMAFIDMGADTKNISVEVRGSVLNAKTTSLPFYKRKKN